MRLRLFGASSSSVFAAVFACAAIVGLATSHPIAAAPIVGAPEDWPAFRGPARDGHSAERGLPTEWSESRNVVWKAPVPGRGWSSPVIVGDRVWLTTATEDRDVVLRAVALDIQSGRVLVDTELFRIGRNNPRNSKNSWASPTPIVDGDRVYVHFGADGTAALTTSGEIVWKTQLTYVPQHGSGGSPALYRDLLIVNCDGNDVAYVAALDTKTGKVRWKTNRREPVSQAYTTPLIIRVGNRDQLISVGAHQTLAYDPLTGKEIWRVDYGDGFSNVPQPVYGHGLVYFTTGFFQPELMAVRPDGSGDVTRTHVAWTLRRAVPLTPSPLLVGDELYIVSDNGIATCLDAKTGTVVWFERLGGTFSASPVFADGRIYYLNEDGAATVIAPGRTFQRLASNTLDGATLASMAIARGSIFIRTDTHLYRIADAPARSASTGAVPQAGLR
jgi:outer membrane protein assembly factor BamB